MSYCVHCGVKLASYEEACPLCGTKVIDPNKPESHDEVLFLDVIKEESQHIDRRFLTLLLTGIWLVPVLATGIVDLAISGSFTWSLYVFGAMGLLWVHIVLPIAIRLYHPTAYVIFDFLADAAYLYLIAGLTGGTQTWFKHMGIWLCLAGGVLTALTVWIFSRPKTSGLLKAGVLLTLLAAAAVTVNLIISNYLDLSSRISWGLWAGIPLLCLGIIMIAFSTSEKISLWIRKKLFI